MLSDEQIEEIRQIWHEADEVDGDHYPGCYRRHLGCAVDALIYDLKYWRTAAAPRLEHDAREVGPLGSPREKELLALCDDLVDKLRLVCLAGSDAYLRGHALLRAAKGLPAEDMPGQAKRAPRRKKPKPGPKNTHARTNYPRLDDDGPPQLGREGGGTLPEV